MNGNPDISSSPFNGGREPNEGEPFLIAYHPAWRKGSTFRIPRKLSIVLLFTFCGAELAYYLYTSKIPGLFPFLIIASVISFLWRSSSPEDSATELLVDSNQLSLLPSGSDSIVFSDVRIYEESVSHIDIFHEQVSGLSKFRLLRHEFHAPDWDKLGPILQARVKINAPEARIHTPLSPPDRGLFRNRGLNRHDIH